MKHTAVLFGEKAERHGFSLVEVVLALGIVAFALTTIIGMFGVLVSRAGDNAERRELRDAINSLGAYLNQGEPLETVTQSTSIFDRVYGWVGSGKSQELLGVTYYANKDGLPDPTGKESVRSIWFPRGATLGSGLSLQTLDAARAGRWVSAKVSLSTNNPISNLPAQAKDYEYAHLAVTVVMNIVESPDRKALTDQERAIRTQLEVPIVVIR